MRTGKETGVAETELAKRRQWKTGSKAGVRVGGGLSNLCRVSQAFVRALAFTQLNSVKNSPKSTPTLALSARQVFQAFAWLKRPES